MKGENLKTLCVFENLLGLSLSMWGRPIGMVSCTNDMAGHPPNQTHQLSESMLLDL